MQKKLIIALLGLLILSGCGVNEGVDRAYIISHIDADVDATETTP